MVQAFEQVAVVDVVEVVAELHGAGDVIDKSAIVKMKLWSYMAIQPTTWYYC